VPYFPSASDLTGGFTQPRYLGIQNNDYTLN